MQNAANTLENSWAIFKCFNILTYDLVVSLRSVYSRDHVHADAIKQTFIEDLWIRIKNVYNPSLHQQVKGLWNIVCSHITSNNSVWVSRQKCEAGSDQIFMFTSIPQLFYGWWIMRMQVPKQITSSLPSNG